MGYNIAGVVIDKNYRDQIEELEQILNKKLVETEVIDFKGASENWKEDDLCDIYFTEQGTLVFLSTENASTTFSATNQRVMSFVLTEVSMSFYISYTQNRFLLRKVLETEGEIVESKGELLDFEEGESDKSELIYHLMEELLDVSFWDIDLEEKCIRYQLEKLPIQSTVKSELKQGDEKVNSTAEITKVKKHKTSFLGKVMNGLRRK
ncbi:MAG: hypothetical protein LBE34_03455 [Flavobacteriaceae bacterium]|jgi:hypothetical protein|nr:hypothetical protein [Flavobacteriaceae bacterium]